MEYLFIAEYSDSSESDPKHEWKSVFQILSKNVIS